VIETLSKLIKKTDVFQYGFISPSEIEYRQNIREICKDNSCGQYGKTWACPPAVGTVEECRKRCVKYNTMLVFTGIFLIENPFDFEGMMRGLLDFKQIAYNLEFMVKPHLNKYLVLSNEGCGICKTCTYPNTSCRFPERLHHSIEGYGILVSELAEKAGVNYNNGEDTITYFGSLLFNRVT
jgi:predicted metal-binding protein